jgi:hypothetical protein
MTAIVFGLNNGWSSIHPPSPTGQLIQLMPPESILVSIDSRASCIDFPGVRLIADHHGLVIISDVAG